MEGDSPACLDTLVDRPMIEAMHLVKYAHVASELARLGALLGRELGASDVEPNTWSAAAAARGVSGVQLVQAMAEQHRYARRMAEWWAGGFDILVTPTLATLPFRFKEGGVEPGRLRALDLPHTSGGDKPLGLATFTGQYNVSGQPAISLPLHWSGDGVPVGVQFIAAYVPHRWMPRSPMPTAWCCAAGVRRASASCPPNGSPGRGGCATSDPPVTTRRPSSSMWT